MDTERITELYRESQSGVTGCTISIAGPDYGATPQEDVPATWEERDSDSISEEGVHRTARSARCFVILADLDAEPQEEGIVVKGSVSYSIRNIQTKAGVIAILTLEASEPTERTSRGYRQIN
jgi:hypothetical protein